MAILKYAILIIAFVAPQIILGQNLKREADQAFDNKNYANALEWAKLILEREEKNLKYLYQAAKSSYEVRAYPLTLKYLKQLLLADSTGAYPDAILLMAETKCSFGAYEEATEYATQIIDNNLGGEFEKKRASRIVDICEWSAGKAADVTPGIRVTNLQSINTKDSDFPMIFGNDHLQYVTFRHGSDKNGVKKCDCNPQCGFTMDWARYQTDSGARDTVGFPGDKRHLSHYTFSGTNHRVYYSDCDCANEGISCALYYREQSDAGWGPPVKLSDRINREGTSNKQPFLVSNFTEGVDRLFYISDRKGPNAFGGWDIWYTDIKDGRFSKPENFKEINTIEDEVTPFFHDLTQTFYFSSNGLPSLGGFDVYKVQRTGTGWCFAANVGAPINSSFEESHFILNKSGDRAFLASNRNNINYDDPDYKYCCTDIFDIAFSEEPAIVDIIVRPFHKITMEPLEGVDLALRNTLEDEPLGAPDEINGTEYVYRQIPLDKQFEAYGRRVGFLPDSSTATTKFADCDTPPASIYVNLYLTPKINLIVSVYDKITGEAFAEGATVELVDPVSEAVILKKSVPDEYPNRYNFELEYDKDYEIRTYKSGSPEYIAFSESKFIDSRVTKITQTLREDLFLFKPLPLYFDHAVPRRLLDLSNVTADTLVGERDNYGTFYKQYQAKKTIYADRNCTRGVPGSERRSEVDNFFAEIDEGKLRLDTLAITLIKRLEEGEYDNINVQVSGFASPVGDPLRNMALSQRRSNSLEKYLQSIFIKEGKINLVNKLQIELKPFGDQRGKGKYSCSGPGIRKRCCEVYGIPSSKERRVEITNIQFNQGPLNDDQGG